MAVSEPVKQDYERTPISGFRVFTRWFRRRLPTGLYTRSLLIIIIPMILLQAVVAAVFMERYLQLVTERLSAATVRNIAAIIDVIESYPQDADYSNITRIAHDKLDLTVSIEPDGDLPPPQEKPFFSILDGALSDEIREQIGKPFWIDTVGNSRLVEIRIKLPNKILRVIANRSQTYASNTHIFIVWMVGTSLVLIGIAVLFLRGQIRPILALTRAAENFGKGQKPDDFSPRGADEVRRAGKAFVQMRERIEKQMEQRTAMLSGVSHDLRTVLTRFKLQLALVGDNPDFIGLNEDVEDMQSMLQGYLDFARGEAEEDVGTLRLSDLFERVEADFDLHGKAFSYTIEGEDEISVRPNAFTRLVLNVASNARRYANTLKVEAKHNARWLTVVFDDDGPGIPENRREDVFKPFFRLDEARNLDESGTGLGLAIVRDIASSHGGGITLGESPLGGLRATVRLPA